jgi:hypothetical protein
MKGPIFIALSALCLMTQLDVQQAQAQATVQRILDSGPTDKLINIVYLSEGYTNTQLSRFIVDASKTLNALLQTSPYSSYKSYFNAYAISVPSIDSGSDHPSRAVVRNTFFNSTYDVNGIARLISIDAAGRSKADSLLELLMPEYDIVIMIVNDNEYGGSGGSLSIASVNSSSAEIAIHEMGHSFARLGDEYSSAYPGYPDTEESNTTRETRRTAIKWSRWILESTPVPTPQTSQYGSMIGLFEGAHYHTTGWFRPKLNCKMNTLGVPFCEICSETIVRSVYGLVHPFATYSPEAPVVELTASQTAVFSTVPMAPDGGSMVLQWYIDGKPRAGAQKASLTVSAPDLANGSHTITITAADTTGLVRNDPARLLRDSISWTLQVSGPTRVQSDRGGRIPTDYALEQNYPNPFNSSTVFSYAIPGKAAVSLRVYNILGELAASLIDGELQEAGRYAAHWTAVAPSGVYYYRLAVVPASGGTANFISSRKMLLLR